MTGCERMEESLGSKSKKRYTLGEEIFNSVSHGVGALLSIAGTAVLTVFAARIAQSLVDGIAGMF